ncbi:MAG: energy-coupling factor transporter transmembrane protein EcfT [Chloroflexi bacterium]|nr:energy-coupling factor transporter transmembrane protein EcfT [Chloroflexota bacterium]
MIGWRYRERDTVVQSLDPRARIVFTALVMASILQVWNPWWAAGLFLLAAAQYGLARLRFRETAKFWAFAGMIAVSLTVFTALTRQAPPHVLEHPWLRLGPFSVSVEAGRFAAAQFFRILALSLVVVILPFTISPALYGVTFRGLGLSDRLAVAMDLSFRFVPSLAADFASAADAQRARGFELDRPRGGPVSRVRSMAPLVVPVTISAILGAEDLVDAMDLRGFGTRPRTWYRELTWRLRDTILIVMGVILFLMVTGAHIAGWTV